MPSSAARMIYFKHRKYQGIEVVASIINFIPWYFYVIKSIDKIARDLNNANIVYRALTYENEIAYSIQGIALQ